MATLTQSFLTLADVYKRTERGAIANVMEVLNNTSQDIMTDWCMMECNDGTKQIHTIRTGLPSVTWGALYEGTLQSKSASQQVQDTTGFLEAMSTVDKRVLDLAGPLRAQVRMSESQPFIEAMAQELVTAMFYHNPATNARLPKGLGARFGTLATQGSGAQIIDAGGTGSDNTSIWFVTHGDRDFCVLYPQGTSGGIKQEDKGEQRALDAAGLPYYVEEEMFSAHVGFAVRDWTNIARVANVDVSNMQAGSVKLYDFMRKAYYKLKSRRVMKVANQDNPGRTVIYCNRDVIESLDALAFNAGTTDNFTRLRPTEVEGKEVLSYRGIPIRETDALLNSETRIV